MTTKLNNQFFFVAPLEVVKVTKDNLEEAAAWCGGRVAEVKSRKVEGRMDSYVWVPTPKGTQISWAFPGMFITRRIVVTLKNELAYTYQVYKRDYFEKNYFSGVTDAVDKTWERAARDAAKPKVDSPEKKIHNAAPINSMIRKVEDVPLPAAPVAEHEDVQEIEVAPPVEGGVASEAIDLTRVKPDHADGTGSVTNHVSVAVEANEAAAEEGR